MKIDRYELKNSNTLEQKIGEIILSILEDYKGNHPSKAIQQSIYQDIYWVLGGLSEKIGVHYEPVILPMFYIDVSQLNDYIHVFVKIRLASEDVKDNGKLIIYKFKQEITKECCK